MLVELTRANDGQKILVDSESVKLIEPDANGTKIVFGADLVRVVKESFGQIQQVLGVEVPGQPLTKAKKK